MNVVTIAARIGALLTVLPLPPARAQQERAAAEVRTPLVGRAVDAGGQPVANAQVTLVWSPPGGADAGAPEVVEVESDARGRFIARLRPQEFYSGWAIREVAPGVYRSSRVHDDLAPGGDCELVVDRAVARPLVSVFEPGFWAELGPLRCEVATSANHVIFHPVPAGEPAPPLPDIARALVRTADGGALCQIELDSPWGGVHHGDEDGGIRLRLPLPIETGLLVIDEDGEPVQGATVLHPAQRTAGGGNGVPPGSALRRVGNRLWRRAGVTDANGVARVTTPLRDGEQWALLVRHPGMAESVVARTWAQAGVANVDGRTALMKDGGFEVTMRPATRLRVTAGGEPSPGAEVMLTAKYHGALLLDRAFAGATDARGECELPLPLDPFESMLHVRIGPGAPWQVRRVALNGELVRLDLSSQRRLSLQVLDETGGPARGLVGVLVAQGSFKASSQRAVVSTDQAGRIERGIGPDGWLVFLAGDRHWVAHEVPSVRRAGEHADYVETLTCEAVGAREFEITNAAGRPVANCRPRYVFVSHGQPLLADRPRELKTVLDDVLTREARRHRSDERGRLRIPFFEGLSAHIIIADPAAGTRARVAVPETGTAKVEMPPSRLPAGLIRK